MNHADHPADALFSKAWGKALLGRCVSPSAGFILCAGMGLSICAIAARTLPLLLILTGLELALALLLRVSPKEMGKEAVYFLIQSSVITGLYCLQIGLIAGLAEGLRTSWQIVLAFFPGLILPRAVSQSRMTQTLSKILPTQTAFILSTSLHFLPMLSTEAHNIYEVQILRGAKILPKDLIHPKNWPDVLHCLAIPLIIQGLKLAGQVALSARNREFGRHKKRTSWPGP